MSDKPRVRPCSHCDAYDDFGSRPEATRCRSCDGLPAEALPEDTKELVNLALARVEAVHRARDRAKESYCSDNENRRGEAEDYLYKHAVDDIIALCCHLSTERIARLRVERDRNDTSRLLLETTDALVAAQDELRMANEGHVVIVDAARKTIERLTKERDESRERLRQRTCNQCLEKF